MIDRKVLSGAFLIAIGLSLGFGVGSLRAQGVPQETPLLYSGTLTEAGLPVTGNRNIRIGLWKHETSTMVAERTCETVANNTPVEGGRFRVALDASCVTAVHAEPEQWVEIQVGDDIIGSRAKLGAVPYALEAADADELQGNPASAFALANHAHPAPQLSCETRTAVTDHSSNSFLGQSADMRARCNSDEVLTGGACTVGSGTGTVSGNVAAYLNEYACVLTSGTDTVHAMARCCKLN